MDTTTCVSHLLAALLRTLLVALLVFGGASSAQPPTLPTAAPSTQQEANPTLRDTILADQELSAHPLSATDNLTVGEAVSSLTLDVPQRTLEQAGVDPDAYPAENLRAGTWEVLRAQVRAARSIPRTAAVILRDLPRHPGNIHANSEGMLLAGREFARVYLQHFGGDR